MVDELRSYIKILRDQGRPSDEVRKNLLAAGWKEADVQAALAEFGPSSPIPPPPPPPRSGGQSMAEIFVNFLSFLLLGITATAVGTLYFQIINRDLPSPQASGYY